MSIEIQNQNGLKLDYRLFSFPAGEIGIQLDKHNIKFIFETLEINLRARIKSSDDLFSLALIKNAIENLLPNIPIHLNLLYVPYARQDRVCNKGESHSLKVLGTFINSLKFRSVTVYDPHSDVTEAVLNNVKVVSQFNIIERFSEFNNYILGNFVTFVSPDAGANKKVSKIAGYYQHENFIRADKLRNLQTGDIVETIVYCDDLQKTNVCILDDICDGGRTFIELAKVLKDKNAGEVSLYVTHGIFSKGIEVLIDNGIDKIFTTDTFTENQKSEYPIVIHNMSTTPSLKDGGFLPPKL